MPVEKSKGKGKGKKRAAEDSNTESNAIALKDFRLEYSKSSRAACRHCEIKICKVMFILLRYYIIIIFNLRSKLIDHTMTKGCNGTEVHGTINCTFRFV